MTIPHQHVSTTSYVGRFAPSPSGPLHFGSLVCALASFLHARQNKGRWLVRIEDIDTPRVNPAMTQIILTSLQQHHLFWDDELVYQSKRQQTYQQALEYLRDNKRLYACNCTRRQIKARNDHYDGHCRNAGLPFDGLAIRFKQLVSHQQFTDMRGDELNIQHPIATEDPVLKRADGIFAYHIAVVADDIEQGVTHVVRGLDLLETTPIHLSLYDALKHQAPQYLHIPVIAQKAGQKLSKQHYSPAIDNNKALENLKMALQYLGIGFDDSSQKLLQQMQLIDNINDLLLWAIEHWTINLIPKQAEILISVVNDVYSLPQQQNAVIQ